MIDRTLIVHRDHKIGSYDGDDESKNEKLPSSELSQPKDGAQFQVFCERMTCHGLADFYQSESYCEKGFWAFAMVAASAFFIFQAYLEVYEYIHNPILTSISIITTPNLIFPQVYICPLNFVNWEYLKGCNESESFVNKTTFLAPEVSDILAGTSSKWKEIAGTDNIINLGPVLEKKEFNCPKKSKESITDYIKRFAFSTDMIIRQCAYQTKNISCSAISTKVLDKEYGVCYLLDLAYENKGPFGRIFSKTSQRNAGIGLSLALDIQHEVLQEAPGTHVPSLIEGFNVRVAETVDPAAIGGTLVSAGTKSRLSLSMVKQKLISFTVSNTPQLCNETNSVKLNIFNESKVSYSQELCKADCSMDVVARKCNCVTPIDSVFLKETVQNMKFCSNEDHDSCIMPMLRGDHSAAGGSLIRCKRSCHAPCESTEIKTTVSHVPFPSSEAVERIIKVAGEKNTENAARVKRGALALSFSSNTNVSGTTETKDGTSIEKPKIQEVQLGTEESKDGNTIGKPEIQEVKIDAKETKPEDPNTKTSNTNDFKGHPQSASFYGKLENINAARWNKSIALLDIAFDKLQYTFIEQNPSRTMTSLVSNIGGQAGLWIGASIFTFVQLIVYITQMSCRKNRKKK